MNKKRISITLLLVLMLTISITSVNADTYNNYTNSIVSCGNNLITGIPSAVPKVISIVYTVIQIAIPVVLVVLGTLDLFKGMTAQKEDEISKGRDMFIKRLIAAVIVFFVFIIIKVVISLAADDGKGPRIISCAECFITNKDCK